MIVQKIKPAAKKAVTKKIVAPAIAPKKTTAPTAKKVAVPPSKKKPPAKKTASPKAKPDAATKTAAKPTPEERYRMVETAAYFIAERNGFQGCSTEHWAAAEIEIAAKLGS